MNWWDYVILGINVVLAIISGMGAFKSVRYYKKSKNITIYAKTKTALSNINEMLSLLPKVLSTNGKGNSKGYNPLKTIQKIGNDLSDHYENILNEVPISYSTELRLLQKKDNFDLGAYINSLIDGNILSEEGLISREDFSSCQERLREIRDFLKEKLEKTEENLK